MTIESISFCLELRHLTPPYNNLSKKKIISVWTIDKHNKNLTLKNL